MYIGGGELEMREFRSEAVRDAAHTSARVLTGIDCYYLRNTSTPVRSGEEDEEK